MPKKPSWFKSLDLLSFGVIALIAIAGCTWLTTGGLVHRQALILCWVVAAAFTFIYGVLLWLRKKFIDEWLWEPKWGFMLQLNGYQPTKSEIVSSIDRIVEGYSKKFGSQTVHDFMVDNTIWVIFNQALDKQGSPVDAVGAKEGFVKARSFTAHVDFDTPQDPIHTTSFVYEVGHIVIGHLSGNWDEKYHIEVAKELGLMK